MGFTHRKTAVKIILKKFEDLMDEVLKNAILEYFKGVTKELETSKSFMKEDDIEENREDD